VKPYFSLDSVVAAAFDCAHSLFGLIFTHMPDQEGYHPDVKVYKVTEMITQSDSEEERLVGIFLHDNFSRAGKQSGAWMSELRTQARNGRDGVSAELSVPIILNNNNFAKVNTSCHFHCQFASQVRVQCYKVATKHPCPLHPLQRHRDRPPTPLIIGRADATVF
jgi:Zn-dependent oligopeptidase